MFSGTAYSGAVINDLGERIVIDLATTRIAPSLPLLHEYQRALTSGTIREISVVALGADANTNAEFFSANVGRIDRHTFSPSAAKPVDAPVRLSAPRLQETPPYPAHLIFKRKSTRSRPRSRT